MIQSIDRKLGEMTHTIGVTLTSEEANFLKQSLRNLGMPDLPLMPVSHAENCRLNSNLVFKKQHEPGFCYTTLVRCLPSFEKAEHNVFSDALERFTDSLGEEPKGKEVILWLCLLEHVLNGTSDVSILKSDSNDPMPFLHVESHLKTLAKISTSFYRFEFRENGGRLHILGEPGNRCGCAAIYCDHGWASRYILQLITREGQTVGSDIDFSELFGADLSRPEPSELETGLRTEKNKQTEELLKKSQTLPKKQVESERRDVDDLHQMAMREQLSNDMVRLLQQQLDARTETLQLTVEALLEQKNKTHRSRRQSEELSSDCLDSGTDDDSGTIRTLKPSDSSSVLERYETQRRFMPQGSVSAGLVKPKHVYTMKRTSSILEPVQEVEDLTRTFDVVQGFVKTQSMREKERASLSKVYAINGLAAPFKDKDLNFLIHFHTALETCGMNPMDRPIDAFEYLGSLKPRNATEELMKQVICRTFDFDEMTVISNPFQLPFINVGMNVTESVLCKCMSLMMSKYRNAWFDQLKCLKVPPFHNEFDEYSNDIVHRDTHTQPRASTQRRRSRRDTMSSGSESTASSSKSSAQKKKSTSILGLRM